MASGYLARRNTLAQQAGFRNYYEQRKFRAEAAKIGAPTGNSKRAAAARDAIGKEIKDLQENGGSLPDLIRDFGELFDEYDVDFDFESDAWYDFLDETSPNKGGKG